jgi:hypothetical protein
MHNIEHREHIGEAYPIKWRNVWRTLLGEIGKKHLKGKTKPHYGHKSFNSFPLRSPTLNGKETRHI